MLWIFGIDITNDNVISYWALVEGRAKSKLDENHFFQKNITVTYSNVIWYSDSERKIKIPRWMACWIFIMSKQNKHIPLLGSQVMQG